MPFAATMHVLNEQNGHISTACSWPFQWKFSLHPQFKLGDRAVFVKLLSAGINGTIIMRYWNKQSLGVLWKFTVLKRLHFKDS